MWCFMVPSCVTFKQDTKIPTVTCDTQYTAYSELRTNMQINFTHKMENADGVYCSKQIDRISTKIK